MIELLIQDNLYWWHPSFEASTQMFAYLRTFVKPVCLLLSSHLAYQNTSQPVAGVARGPIMSRWHGPAGCRIHHDLRSSLERLEMGDGRSMAASASVSLPVFVRGSPNFSTKLGTSPVSRNERPQKQSSELPAQRFCDFVGDLPIRKETLRFD